MPSNIFLIGPMGAGKTTIGRQLAKSLGKQFKDSDHEIVERTGVSIPTIFDIEGEEGFRRRERDIIDTLTQEPDLVLATGGGAILLEENRHCLRSRGIVIYLQAPIKQLLKRTAKDRNRPLLQTEDPRKRLEELLEIREPLYQQTADMVINTNGRSVPGVVKTIILQLEKSDS